MLDLQPLDRNTAPEGSRDTLDAVAGKLGFVPNVLGVMAHSPAALKAYVTMDQLLAESSLSAAEKTVVLLTASLGNGCGYCMAAHSAGAPLPARTLEALRAGKPVSDDARLEALRRFTAKIVDKRGWVEDADVAAFVDAGFEPAQVLDVLTAVSMKTLSNYTNHIVEPSLDKPLQKFAWKAA